MVKEDIKAGLEAAVQEWGASVTAGHGNTQTTITTSQGRTLDVKYVVQVWISLVPLARFLCLTWCGLIQGGDYTKIQDTAAWIASTNQSEYWRVIEVEQVVPVVDMLPDDIRSTVKMLMIPLLGRSVLALSGSHHPR